MRVLMLGNSFTSAQGLPQKLESLLGEDVQVQAHTRGGARLAEQLNPKTRLGARTLSALKAHAWDYVVMQEMSNGPVKARERFLESTAGLCRRARAIGATPVLYETWAYEKGSARLEKAGLGYEEMHSGLASAYEEAARVNGALLAPVGDAFFEHAAEGEELYAADSTHPNERGADLAAKVLAETIRDHAESAGLA